MDGYALRAAQTLAASSGSPVGIPVVGKVFTGEGRSTLTANTAMGITTGAPVPINADAVIPHEQVTVRNGKIFIEKPCLWATASFHRRKTSAAAKRS